MPAERQAAEPSRKKRRGRSAPENAEQRDEDATRPAGGPLERCPFRPWHTTQEPRVAVAGAAAVSEREWLRTGEVVDELNVTVVRI